MIFNYTFNLINMDRKKLGMIREKKNIMINKSTLK